MIMSGVSGFARSGALAVRLDIHGIIWLGRGRSSKSKALTTGSVVLPSMPMKSNDKTGDVALGPNECLETFPDGEMRLIQSRTGYRFSVDALLLSDFLTVRKGERVLDLGTGCGVIPLKILSRGEPAWVVGLEIQGELARLAAKNAVISGLDDRMRVVLGDLRHLPFKIACCDVVVCNPPYRRNNSGRVNPDPEKAVARHEICASADDVLAASRRLLKNKGRLCLVYPASRLADLLCRMRRHGLEPKRLEIVYPDTAREAKMALVEAVAGGRPGLKVLPPVFDQGRYSIS